MFVTMARTTPRDVIPLRVKASRRDRSIDTATKQYQRGDNKMHYCSRSEADILADVVRGSIPSDALVNDCCWRRICQVRGRNFNQVDADTWREICAERGYVFGRQNSRGF